MKKILTLLLSLTMVLALSGCGKEQMATYVMIQEQDGMTITDTQTVKAKGDLVYEMNEDMVIDLSGIEDESKEQVLAVYEETFNEMKNNAPETVTVNVSNVGNMVSVQIHINLNGADLQDLIDGGYIVATSANGQTPKVISFKQTCAALEAGNYVKQ